MLWIDEAVLRRVCCVLLCVLCFVDEMNCLAEMHVGKTDGVKSFEKEARS